MSDSNPIEEGSVEISSRSGIAEITFGHPRGNSLPAALLKRISTAITECSKRTDINVIGLRSLGERVFCGGASFDELRAVKTIEHGEDFFSGFAGIIMAVRRSPKFVVARVQGKAIGGGVGVVAACDYALATNDATIRLSELALGFGPFVISAAVERKLGLAAFSALAIDADNRDAGWAYQRGLYSSLHTSISELDQAYNKMLEKLAASNPAAMEKIKAILWEGVPEWHDLLKRRAAISSSLVVTEFVQREIMAAHTKLSSSR